METMGVRACKMPFRPVNTGIQMLLPMATPASSFVPAWPLMTVSNRLIPVMHSWVIRMGIMTPRIRRSRL